jgi:hypothetical protein
MFYADFSLTGMHKTGQRCAELIEKTADALGNGVLSLMLIAVQKDNLDLSINQAIKWYVFRHDWTRMLGAYFLHRVHDEFEQNLRLGTEAVIKLCVAAFPSIWVNCHNLT